MSSSFGGLEIALSSLQAQQRALDVTGQNLANANTPGYARESAALTETPDLTVTGVNGQFGTGVQVTGVERHTDPFLTALYNQQTSQLYDWQTTDQSLQQIEAIFNEPSTQGLGSALDNFWSAWQALADNPQDDGARAAVVAQGANLQNDLQSLYGELTGMWQTANTDIAQDVSDFNSLASQVAALNGQIVAAQAQGDPSNSLLDQRDQLINQLSQLSNLSVQNEANGAVRIFISGVAVVDGVNSLSLAVSPSAATSTLPTPEIDEGNAESSATTALGLSGNPTINGKTVAVTSGMSLLDIANAINSSPNIGVTANIVTSTTGGTTTYTLQIIGQNPGAAVTYVDNGAVLQGLGILTAGGAVANQVQSPSAVPVSVVVPGAGGITAGITGGSIGAKLRLVNQVLTNTAGTGGGYLDRVNALASQLIAQVNNLHLAGFDLSGNPGQDFFTGTSAANIGVNPAVAANLSLVAASGASNLPADGSNALRLAGLQNASLAGLNGQSANGYYQGIISTLGVAAQQSHQMVTQNQLLSTTLQNQIQGVQGVSIDQEATRMVEYQQAYQAAAEYESTVNSMISTLITALGG